MMTVKKRFGKGGSLEFFYEHAHANDASVCYLYTKTARSA